MLHFVLKQTGPLHHPDSGGSKTKQLVPVHLDLPFFWKFRYVTCVPACVILYHVTRQPRFQGLSSNRPLRRAMRDPGNEVGDQIVQRDYCLPKMVECLKLASQ